MRWRSGGEQPNTTESVTALIVVRDPDGGAPFIAGIYSWNDGRWVSEEDGRPIEDSEFWWVLEADLLALVGKEERQ